jgi:hypothetical protein
VTSELVARRIVDWLIDDEEWETPTGEKAYSYFMNMPTADAWKEYDQIYQLPEGLRMRDLMERLDKEKGMYR